MAKKRPKAMSPPTDLYVSKLLGKISEGKRVMSFRKGEKVVSQGAHADAIYFGYRLPSLGGDRKSTRLNSSHVRISYAVFCLKKKKTKTSGFKRKRVETRMKGS